MSPFISVITCAHNPNVNFLDQTLAALKTQTLNQERWEFLLIDNASQQPLRERVDISWHSQGRHVREDKVGLTEARLCGIRQSKGQVLVFVDDDNVLSANYLEEAAKIAEERTIIGAWSGHIAPRFEQEPPAWTRRYWGVLAIREVTRDQWSNLAHLDETMPCGAGLCVRREVADFYVHLHDSGQRAIVLDRAGKSLVSGGDNDMAACACDIGLGVGLFAHLCLMHLMPPERLNEEYLLRLVEGVSYSGVVLRSFRALVSPPPRHRLAKIADIVRLLSMSPRQRRFHRAAKRGEARAFHHLSSAPL